MVSRLIILEPGALGWIAVTSPERPIPCVKLNKNKTITTIKIYKHIDKSKNKNYFFHKQALVNCNKIHNIKITKHTLK